MGEREVKEPENKRSVLNTSDSQYKNNWDSSVKTGDFNPEKRGILIKNKDLIIEKVNKNVREVIAEEDLSVKSVDINSDDFSEEINEGMKENIGLMSKDYKVKFINNIPKDINYIPCHTLTFSIEGEINTTNLSANFNVSKQVFDF